MRLRPVNALPTQAVIVSDAFLCTRFCEASRLALSMMSSLRTESTVPGLSANVNSVPIFTASVDRPSTAKVAVSCSIQFSSRTAGWPTVTRAAAAGALRTGSSRKATAAASSMPDPCTAIASVDVTSGLVGSPLIVWTTTANRSMMVALLFVT
jgi:hypothetical protein